MMRQRSRREGSNTASALLVLSIVLGGCSSSYQVRSPAAKDGYTYDRVNEALKGQQVTLDLGSRKGVAAKDVTLTTDSVVWLEPRTGERSAAGMWSVDRINSRRSLAGGLEGMGLGVLIGGGAGAIAGNAGDNGKLGSGAGAAIGSIVGGGAGLFIGFLSGLIVGHSDHYEFRTTTPRDSSQNRK